MVTEYLDIIDDDDKVIDTVERDIARAQKLKRRFVHIYIFNDDGDILIQQRSSKRDFAPNLIDPSAAGHVQSGESYEDAAHREMMEEVSIQTDITHALDVPGWYGICRVFTATYNGEFQVDGDEAKHACFVPVEKLLFLMEHFPFVMMRGFSHTFKHYMEHINK
jgi:16S rRNA (adenine1518-N6/adenine1519-N6)-dimethyltransferase